MPSLTELLTKAGVTIPAGVNIVELAESSDEIKGLATAKNDLHQWKLENKPLLDSLQAKQAELEAAAAKALEEKEKLAIQNKDYETLAQLNADKLKKLEDGLNASRERAKQEAHQKAIEQVSAMLGGSPIAKDIASTKVFTELNEAGEPVVTIKLGDKSYSTVDEAKTGFAAIDAYAAMMPVGGQSQSPAATGQTGGQSGQQPQQPKPNAAAEAAAKKGDLHGFLAASININQ